MPEMTSSPCSGDLAAIINSGKAYQNLEATTAGKKAQEDQEHFLEKHQGKNKIALQIMNKLFKSRRLKCDIGEELYFVAQKIKELIKEALDFADQVEKRVDGIDTEAIPVVKKKFAEKNAAIDQCDELFEEVEHAIDSLDKDLKKELEKVGEVMLKLDKVNPLKNPQMPS